MDTMKQMTQYLVHSMYIIITSLKKKNNLSKRIGLKILTNI